MTKLSVNVNKVATIRNARGGNLPDLVQIAKDCENFGAQGITVHPRPDERHIRYKDVFNLNSVLKTEFNIEGYPSKEFLELILKIKPHQVTLVPDSPHAITSNAGWDTKKHQNWLTELVGMLNENEIRSSIFVEPVLEDIEYAATTKVDRIELYTEDYAKGYDLDKENAIGPYIEASELAAELNIGLNAGHDLNLQNLRYFTKCIPNLMEVSIGHALISDALYFGLKETIRLYLKKLK